MCKLEKLKSTIYKNRKIAILNSLCSFKVQFSIFEVGLYDVLTFCRWRSAVSLFGEGGEITAAEVSIVLLQTG